MTQRYAVVDIEATGPNIAEGDRIIQIAAIIFEDNEKVQQYEMLINPEIPIPAQISKLTGIYQKDVEKAPKLESVINLWYQRLKDCIFVGHNLAFDLRIMKEVFAENDFEFDPIAIDTFILSKIIYPTSKGYGLSDLADVFGVELIDAHNALVDASFTAALVNNLANEVQNLEANCSDALLTYAKHLPYNETLFFEQPEIFINKESFADPVDIIDSIDINEKDKLLGKYLNDEWKKMPSIVVEDEVYPVQPSIKAQVVAEAVEVKPTLFVSQPSDETNRYVKYLQTVSNKKIVALKNSDAYLNVELVEKIQSKMNPSLLNQTELITWMGIIRFKSSSQTYDITEINREHQIKTLLTKLSKQLNVAVMKNKTYRKQFKKAQNADLVILSYYSLLYYQKENILTELFANFRQIIFEDGQDLLTAGLNFQQKKIALSSAFTQIQSIYDQLNFEWTQSNSEHTQLLETLQNLISNINLLNLMIEKELLPNTKATHRIHQYISNQNAQMLKILDELQRLSDKTLQLSKNLVIKEAFKETLTHLNQDLHMFMKYSKEYFWSVRGRILNNRLYHIELFANALNFDESFWPSISANYSYLVFSPGNFNFKEHYGLYSSLGKPNIKYIPLKKNNYERKVIKVPADYIPPANAQDINAELVNLTKQLIQDEKANQYLVILNHKETITELYHQLLNDSDIISDYLIQAKGHHGSVRRMINRVKDEDKFILLVSLNDLENYTVHQLPDNMRVVLLKLPFYSPEYPRLKALNENEEDEQIVFEEVNLPLMIQRLKELLALLGLQQHYYLMDDRIFTRFYSRQVQNNLKPIISFEMTILDTFIDEKEE